MSFIWLLICQIDNEYSSHLTQVKEHGFLQHMFSSIIFDSLNIYIYILTTLFIINIARCFQSQGCNWKLTTTTKATRTSKKKKKNLMCITLFGTLFRDVHWQKALCVLSAIATLCDILWRTLIHHWTNLPFPFEHGWIDELLENSSAFGKLSE